VVAVLAVLLTVVASPRAIAGDDGRKDLGRPTVRTAGGWLAGTRANGVESFLGIPYAAPPVGDLRWRPPAAARPWSGIRDATRFGNRCAQLASTNGAGSLTEDCLFLNVQRPSGTNRRSRLPVFVFFHGGGYVNGSSDQHDGSTLARQGRIVTVTVNYRLGVLGALAHPALTHEGNGDSGNYGFLDQQASLRWVHQQIAAFGGDPQRVAIGGQSSSGQQICSHLSAPGSRGLFSAAIIESAPGCFAHPSPKPNRPGPASRNPSGVRTTRMCWRAFAHAPPPCWSTRPMDFPWSPPERRQCQTIRTRTS